MSEEAEEALAIRWHEFHNDPNSDVILKAGDGIRLGASRHRLSALSPKLHEMFGQPSSHSVVKREGELHMDVEEVDLDYDSDVLAAVLLFANNPLEQANRRVVAPLTSRQCQELLDFFRVYECPDALRELALTRWLKYATTCAERVSIAHAIAPLGWADGLNRVLSNLTPADFAEISTSSLTFWAFIEGFPEAEQRQLLRTLVRVNRGLVVLPDGLADISTARSNGGARGSANARGGGTRKKQRT